MAERADMPSSYPFPNGWARSEEAFIVLFSDKWVQTDKGFVKHFNWMSSRAQSEEAVMIFFPDEWVQSDGRICTYILPFLGEWVQCEEGFSLCGRIADSVLSHSARCSGQCMYLVAARDEVESSQLVLTAYVCAQLSSSGSGRPINNKPFASMGKMRSQHG